MQKFRFLLPLLILTASVAVISYSLRLYGDRNSENANDRVLQQNLETTGDISPEQSPPPERKGIIGKIINVVKPKPTSTSVSQGTSNLSISPTPVPIDTKLNDDQIDLPSDQEKSITILLSSEKDRPTAYTLNFSYDPKVITIVKIEQGNIWDRTTLLKRLIDPTKGFATISAGQALGSQNASTGQTLVTVFVKAKSTTNVVSQLILEDSSAFAYVGVDHSIPLKSKSIEIRVE